MMKSPERLVTKHVLQGVLEVNATNATWSILGAARLFFVREPFPIIQSIEQSITLFKSQSWYVAKGKTLY